MTPADKTRVRQERERLVKNGAGPSERRAAADRMGVTFREFNDDGRKRHDGGK